MAGIATRSVAVFFLTCYRGAGACNSGEYWSVGVKARVVNGKQMDVVASRSDRSRLSPIWKSAEVVPMIKVHPQRHL